MAAVMVAAFLSRAGPVAKYSRRRRFPSHFLAFVDAEEAPIEALLRRLRGGVLLVGASFLPAPPMVPASTIKAQPPEGESGGGGVKLFGREWVGGGGWVGVGWVMTVDVRWEIGRDSVKNEDGESEIDDSRAAAVAAAVEKPAAVGR